MTQTLLLRDSRKAIIYFQLLQYTLAVMNPDIMNNFWLFSGSTSIEIMSKKLPL